MKAILLLAIASIMLSHETKIETYEKPIATITAALEEYHKSQFVDLNNDNPVAGITVLLKKYHEAEQQEENNKLYDITLPSELQLYTYDLCQKYSVDTELILAIMQRENTNLNPSAIGHNRNGSSDYGLMQINSSNHRWLSEELGITNFLDEKQSILAGVYMVAEIQKSYTTDLHEILIAYNMGPAKIKELHAKGIYSTEYSRAVEENIRILRSKKK